MLDSTSPPNHLEHFEISPGIGHAKRPRPSAIDLEHPTELWAQVFLFLLETLRDFVLGSPNTVLYVECFMVAEYRWGSDAWRAGLVGERISRWGGRVPPVRLAYRLTRRRKFADVRTLAPKNEFVSTALQSMNYRSIMNICLGSWNKTRFWHRILSNNTYCQRDKPSCCLPSPSKENHRGFVCQ